MGRCYLCQQSVEPSNDVTLFIGAIGAIYGLNHVAKTFSATYTIVKKDPKSTIAGLQELAHIPHAHIYPVENCNGSPKGVAATEKYPEAYKIIKSLAKD